MISYRITNLSRKEVSTKYGLKPQIKCDLTTTDGATTTQEVTLWSSFPDFANLKDGDVVTGELEIKVNGQYTNKTLTFPNKAPGGAYKKPQVNMEKVMEKKEQSIGKFQDNKELSIKISSTMRMAVELTIAEIGGNGNNAAVLNGKTYTAFETTILKWRKWLWENWDAKDTDFDPFPSDNYPKRDVTNTPNFEPHKTSIAEIEQRRQEGPIGDQAQLTDWQGAEEEFNKYGN